MRQKTFMAAPLEDIIALSYYPGRQIIIQVGIGNDVDGKFIEIPEQNYENYTLDLSNGLEQFESNPEIMQLIEQFKDYCWSAAIEPIRSQIEQQRIAEQNQEAQE